MNDLQLELTKLIGKKELTFGCVFKGECMNDWNEYVMLFDSTHEVNSRGVDEKSGRKYMNIEIIGHPATETDFKKWMNDNGIIWEQRDLDIKIFEQNILISYDSSKKLLDQDEETLIQIINFIKSSK